MREVRPSYSDPERNPHNASKTFNGLLKPVDTKEQQPRGVNDNLDAQSLEKTKEKLTRDYKSQTEYLSTVVEQHKQLLATDAEKSDLKSSRAEVYFARKTVQRTESELNFFDIKEKHQQDIEDISNIHLAARGEIKSYYQANRERVPGEASLVEHKHQKAADEARDAREEASKASKEAGDRYTEYLVLSERFPRMRDMEHAITSKALEEEKNQEKKATVAKAMLTSLIQQEKLKRQMVQERREQREQLEQQARRQFMIRQLMGMID